MRKIGWFDIYVEDMERAQAFYETVLDTTLSTMGDPNDPTAQMRAFGDDFTSHGAGGALVKLQYANPGPGGSMVYFSCDDSAGVTGTCLVVDCGYLTAAEWDSAGHAAFRE